MHEQESRLVRRLHDEYALEAGPSGKRVSSHGSRCSSGASLGNKQIVMLNRFIMTDLVERAPASWLRFCPFTSICRHCLSEPPRTRTWNLEIKSLFRRSSSGCWRFQNPLKLAGSAHHRFPTVSRCCSGLVSKLVSATASLAAARVREGSQDSASTTAYRRGGAMAARLTLD